MTCSNAPRTVENHGSAFTKFRYTNTFVEGLIAFVSFACSTSRCDRTRRTQASRCQTPPPPRMLTHQSIKNTQHRTRMVTILAWRLRSEPRTAHVTGTDLFAIHRASHRPLRLRIGPVV